MTKDRSRHRRLLSTGIGSGILSCMCGLIPLVLIITGTLTTAVFISGFLMQIEPYIISSGILIMVLGTLVQLRNKGSLNLDGIRREKFALGITAAIFIGLLITLFLVIRPFVMKSLMS